MRIEYLADHEELVPELASWHFAEWSFLQPNETLEERTLRLRRCCGHREIPTVVIGLLGNVLCGSGMLVAQDMDSRPNLTPWLAGLYVAPAYRRKGYGTKLIERVVQEAAALKAQALYLYTPNSEQYYCGRGWSVVERSKYRGADVSIMSRSIAA
jgi:GNAT superfamily N-acetyltransferase